MKMYIVDTELRLGILFYLSYQKSEKKTDKIYNKIKSRDG